MNPFKEIYDLLPAGTRRAIRSWSPDSLKRWYAHRNTDVYLISYPKCGRTWLRLMIGRAIAQQFSQAQDEDMLFLRWKKKPHPQVPWITVVHDDRPMLKAPEELQTSKEIYRDKRVIFLARDPRDVIVSSYFEMKNRGQLFGDNPYETRKAVFAGSLPEFIHKKEGGFETILSYYNIWAENRNIPRGFLLVRYEDMKVDAQNELRRAIDFLGLGFISDEILAEAVGFASFDNMRKMEARGEFKDGMLRPADQSNQDSYKTRKGKVRGFADHLEEAEISFLNQAMREKLSPYFGYTA
jgi:Sulfotransferase domain